MIKQEKCIEFRKLFEEGHLTIVDIARMYKVSDGTVRRSIVRAGGNIPIPVGRKYSTELVKKWADLSGCMGFTIGEEKPAKEKRNY
jgi:hypothetical protein